MSLSLAEGQFNRAYTITPTDHRGLIVIPATLFMSWMVILFLFRLYTRSSINGPVGIDDVAAGIGTVGTAALLRFLFQSALL